MSNTKSLNEGLNDFLQNLNATCQSLYIDKYLTPELRNAEKIKEDLTLFDINEACNYWGISLADLKRRIK